MFALRIVWLLWIQGMQGNMDKMGFKRAFSQLIDFCLFFFYKYVLISKPPRYLVHSGIMYLLYVMAIGIAVNAIFHSTADLVAILHNSAAK